MRRTVFASLRMLLVMSLVLGIAYPLLITATAQGLFGDRANGSLVSAGGATVGSELLGQPFDGPGWFHPRPGAYDPAASGPSNLGPTNPALGDAVRGALDTVSASDRPTGSVPVDAVTGSGSGLDPDISPAYARLQAPRVAAARGLDVADVLALVDTHTEGRTFGFLGEPHVNVLLLNLALEGLASMP
ncbi:MAG: potassium-transporting ATPase subunit KdpC [Actinomycetota bacterium]